MIHLVSYPLVPTVVNAGPFGSVAAPVWVAAMLPVNHDRFIKGYFIGIGGKYQQLPCAVDIYFDNRRDDGVSASGGRAQQEYQHPHTLFKGQVLSVVFQQSDSDQPTVTVFFFDQEQPGYGR